MVKFINELFGISNEISVPIIISLIVFITGGVSSFTIKTIGNYYSSLRTRNTFRNIIKEIILNCQYKDRLTKSFYPIIRVDNFDDYKMKFPNITYLELTSRLDFNSILHSFNVLGIYRLNKKLRNKSFNKIWSIIEDLKFIEERILIDFETFSQKLNKHETLYNSNLEKLRQQRDLDFHPYIGKDLGKTNLQQYEIDYIIAQNEVWENWSKIDEKIRRHNSLTYKEVIYPLHLINRKHARVKFTLNQNNYIIAAIHEYEQMDKLMKINYNIFYNYYRTYRSKWIILTKCLQYLS